MTVFLSTFTGWGLAVLLTRKSLRQAAMDGAIAGMFCTLIALLMIHAGIGITMTLPAMMLLAVFLPFQQKISLAEHLTDLFLAVGCWAFFDFCNEALLSFFSAPVVFLICMILTAAFWGAAWRQKERFPEGNWPEKDSETGKLLMHGYDQWFLLGLLVFLEVTLRFFVGAADTLQGTAFLILGYAVLFWAFIGGVSLLDSSRQDKHTILVDQNYRNEMESFMSVIRSQRHDYNFHVQALAGLISEGNLEACRRYVDNLVKDSASMNTILPVKDPAIAALIYSFRTKAMEEGIELHLDIQNDLSGVITSVYETNKVIGNLLQNAIDEVKTHRDKSFGIHLFILKRGENCVIRVANKVTLKENPAAYLEDVYQPGHTTKEGHDGIGLCSIRNLLRRYRGVVYSRIEGDIIHFIAKIPINMREGG